MANNLFTRRCTKCHEEKTLEEFPADTRNRSGKASHCRRCKSKDAIARHKRNPEKHKAAMKKFFASEKGHALLRRKQMLYKYNLTPADYNEMLRLQEHKCAICGTTDPRSRSNRFQIDHCHTTNHVRGLLCGYCNRTLAKYRENEMLFLRFIAYLKGQLPNVGPPPGWKPYVKKTKPKPASPGSS